MDREHLHGGRVMDGERSIGLSPESWEEDDDAAYERILALDTAIANRHLSAAAKDADPVEETRVVHSTRKLEKQRKRECLTIIKLKVSGCSMPDIAQVLYPGEEFPIANRKMWARLAEGRRKKWILGNDQERIDNEMIPATIDGINELIIARDKDTLLKSADGFGIFKSHQSVKQTTQQLTELRVRIEVDPGSNGGSMDQVGANKFQDYGTPRLIEEGKIVEG